MTGIYVMLGGMVLFASMRGRTLDTDRAAPPASRAEALIHDHQARTFCLLLTSPFDLRTCRFRCTAVLYSAGFFD